jgi:hypothetical protein
MLQEGSLWRSIIQDDFVGTSTTCIRQKKRPAEVGRFLHSIAIFVILITSTIPIAATIPVWLNDDDLIPTTSKLSIPTPITITTVTIVNTDTSTTGANAELNALSGRRSGTKQGSGSNNN